MNARFAYFSILVLTFHFAAPAKSHVIPGGEREFYHALVEHVSGSGKLTPEWLEGVRMRAIRSRSLQRAIRLAEPLITQDAREVDAVLREVAKSAYTSTSELSIVFLYLTPGFFSDQRIVQLLELLESVPSLQARVGVNWESLYVDLLSRKFNDSLRIRILNCLGKKSANFVGDVFDLFHWELSTKLFPKLLPATIEKFVATGRIDPRRLEFVRFTDWLRTAEITRRNSAVSIFIQRAKNGKEVLEILEALEPAQIKRLTELEAVVQSKGLKGDHLRRVKLFFARAKLCMELLR